MSTMFREQEICGTSAEEQDVRADVHIRKSLTVNYVQGAGDCGPSAQDQDIRAVVYIRKSLTVNYVQGARDCGPSAEDQDVRADVHIIKCLTVNYVQEQEIVVHQPEIKMSELMLT
jgi:hypothetical protein